MKLLVISCSLNPNSRSAILAKEAYERLKPEVEVDFIDLRDYPLPFCDGGAAYEHPNVQAINKKFAEAAGVLVATPIYNYDVSSVVHNLFELTGSAWREKVVGFLCSAAGQRSYMSVMSFADNLMLHFRCTIVPDYVYAIGEDFDGNEIVNEEILKRIDLLNKKLIGFTRALG